MSLFPPIRVSAIKLDLCWPSGVVEAVVVVQEAVAVVVVQEGIGVAVVAVVECV